MTDALGDTRALSRNLVYVRLERLPCYGPCPIYSVTLSTSGDALWHGEGFVERLGEHRGSTDGADVRRLISFARRVGFFRWDHEYVEPVTDHPGTRVTITEGSDEPYSVFQYASNKPRDFWTLATLIDGVCARVDWEHAASGDGEAY